MERNHIAGIINRFLSFRFRKEVEERVQKWIIKEDNQEEKERASFEYWTELESEIDASTYSALRRVNERIGYARKRSTFLSPYRKIAHIAAILIPVACFLVGGYYYVDSLENRLVEVSTLNGETKHVLLPDSSEIWLNAGTIIRYSTEFGEDQRLVTLDGEAYFSVKRNVEIPFIVEANQLSVKVLGTKFNVKAYAKDEKTTTALTSGRVEVSANDSKRWILNPSQQISYADKGSSVEITEVSSEDTYAWMTGQLIFTNVSFDEIMKTVERNFDVVITNRVNVPSTKKYTVKFLKNENPEDVLNVLKEMIGFTFQKKGNEIILSK